MQKYFFNGKCITLNDSMETSEAFFCNDESFVFVGKNDEIKSLCGEGDELVNLEQQVVVPTFYDSDGHIFEMIEGKIKTQFSDDLIEKVHENDENFEIFDNFEIYKNEFLKLQEEFISKGITTIFEMNITKKSFVFWKKLAEKKLIKIDIVGYVNIVSSKDVMDNNCVSYRKYVNHFRLGGYYLQLDGRLLEKQAWVEKHYKNEKSYAGVGYVLDEKLSFILKSALEEKKIIFVEANGGRALNQFLFVAEEFYKDKNPEDYSRYLPVIRNLTFVTKKQLKKIKKLGVAIDFDISLLMENFYLAKKLLRGFSHKKLVPIKMALDMKIPIMVHFGTKQNISSPFKIIKFLMTRELERRKVIGKINRLDFDFSLNLLAKHPAKYCFESDYKGSIENSKKANFIVLKNGFNFDDISKTEIQSVFVNFENVFDNQKS